MGALRFPLIHVVARGGEFPLFKSISPLSSEREHRDNWLFDERESTKSFHWKRGVTTSFTPLHRKAVPRTVALETCTSFRDSHTELFIYDKYLFNQAALDVKRSKFLLKPCFLREWRSGTLMAKWRRHSVRMCDANVFLLPVQPWRRLREFWRWDYHSLFEVTSQSHGSNHTVLPSIQFSFRSFLSMWFFESCHFLKYADIVRVTDPMNVRYGHRVAIPAHSRSAACSVFTYERYLPSWPRSTELSPSWLHPPNTPQTPL